jgi:hypothetical protein
MSTNVTGVETRMYRQTEVSLYLPSEFAYHIKQVALNKRKTFLDLALTAFSEFIQNPIPEASIEYWKIQGRDNKVPNKGSYRSSLMLSSSMNNRLRDMAADREISFNGLMMCILREKYGEKGNGVSAPLPKEKFGNQNVYRRRLR